MSHEALNQEQFGEGTVSGSKTCENCGKKKRGVAYDRETGTMMCDDCWNAQGRKSW